MAESTAGADPAVPAVRIHETALIEQGVTIGAGTAIWDHVHIRRGATVGAECIIGEKTYIAYDVRIGHRVKINAGVYLCAGVTVEDGVMIAAHVVFTNDRFPRATVDGALHTLAPSAPDEHTLPTRVERGATIGANATIGPGLTIGAFAMVGMGSVVTKDVPPYALVFGNPARVRGAVCRCGQLAGDAALLESGAPPLCARCARGPERGDPAQCSTP